MSAANPHEPDAFARRVRLAQVSSSLGAGVLGLGIGVLAASHLAGLGLPISGAGLLLHAWGMADQHRMEAKQGAPHVWWSTLLYWICWASLAGMAAWAASRRI